MKWVAALLVYVAVALGLYSTDHAWVSLLGFHLAILISLFLAKPKIPLKALWIGNTIQWGLVNILVCGSSGVTLYLLWENFEITGDLSTRLQEMGLPPSNWIAFLLYFTFINPLLEEYFWRGYLGSTSTNFAPSDFLYSGFHGLILWGKVQPPTILYSLVVLVLAGWFWRQVARIDGGLRAPVLGHMTADFAILVAIFLRA